MNRTSTALPSASYQANVRKVTLLALLVLLAAVCYWLWRSTSATSSWMSTP